MIIWINCKITDQRWTPIGTKGNLISDDRFNIAKYFFASLKALDPVISKILLNIELDGPYKGRELELETYVREMFDADKLGTIEWFRCNTMDQWRNVQQEVNAIDDDTMYVPGAEDHIFMDNSIDLWKRGLELIAQDDNTSAVFAISHFPETLRHCFMRSHRISEDNKFIACYPYDHELSSNYILKKELFNKYLEHNDVLGKIFFRIEDFKVFWAQTLYIATKEISRHYDGYTHVHMDLNVCPPLTIPVDFFNKGIIIRYGFDDRDPNCVNINPTKNFYSVDANGTDYKWILEDIPLFWKPYIKEIQISPNIDENQMRTARNQHLENLSRAAVFGHSVPIPKDWIQPHML